MSNAVFPSLPGETWPRVRVYQKPATVKRANGRRYALSDQQHPDYLYRINYSFLRPEDFAVLGGFWLARGGALDDFLFDDRDDNTATNQLFSTGDGVTTTFQLLRTFGGYSEPVLDLNGAAVFKVGATVTAGTVTAGGKVTFASAPASGALLTWSGAYYWRCAFKNRQQEFEEFLRGLRTTRTLELESSR